MQASIYNSSMTATGHALVAALIAAKFNNPYIALPISFVSHFACDILPHWDSGTHHREKTKKRLFYESVADVLIGFVAAFLLYNFVTDTGNYILLFFAIIAAQLPDWITAPYFILNIRHPLVNWSKSMYKLQHKLNSRLDKPWGIVTQVLTVILLYIFLFKIF